PKTYEEAEIAYENEQDPGKKAVLKRIVDKLAPDHQKTGKSLSPKDRMKLDAYKKDHDIEDDDDLTADQINEALNPPKAPAHTKDRQTFEDHWGKRFNEEAEKPYTTARNAIFKQYGVDKDASRYDNNKDAIESALQPYEIKREQTKA